MKTIILNFSISGTKISAPFHATCSVTDKEFSGEVVIEYCPAKEMTLEFVDVGDQIDKYCTRKITVEDLVNWIFQEVKKSLPLKSLKVTVDVLKSDAHCPVRVWLEE
ncbi:MAG: hypothetical protein AAB645_01980 [Patescibacteria group bacterium]